MILTVDKSDMNYTSLVLLVDSVIVDGIPIKNCVYVDTVSGKYICYTDPLRVVNGRSLTEEKYAGKIEVTFKGSQDLIDYYLDEINNKIQN
mgnify:CR=1 FL=1